MTNIQKVRINIALYHGTEPGDWENVWKMIGE
jgi:hypothetical protein